MLEKAKILSRLIGNENIDVVVGDYSTASFDLKKRTIHIPNFTDEMNESVVESLCIHEISHGLFTPLDGWNECVINKKYNKYVLNVLEDIRIEKLILMKYPNAIKSFRSGYDELFKRDFFGLSNVKNINELGFIDRLNLHTKLRTILPIKFKEKELNIVKAAKDTMTWDDVIDVYHMIDQYIKENPESENNGFDDLNEEGLSTKSITVKAFEENVEALTKNFDENQKEWKQKERDCSRIKKNYLNDKTYIVQKKSKIETEDKKVVDNLIKNFEMKKSANIKKCVKIKNTGKLNVNKLYRYKYDDRLFLTKDDVPVGKNHALVILIDFSFSMSCIIKNAVRKALILTSFCVRQNIPIIIYTFTSNNRLHEWINSITMNKMKVLKYIKFLYAEINNKNSVIMNNMGYTPLIESYATVIGEIDDMLLSNRKYEKITFVSITDGYGSIFSDEKKIKIGSKNVYVKVGKTCKESMSNLNEYLKKRQVKTINMHICSNFIDLEKTDMNFDKKILFDTNTVNDVETNKMFVKTFIEEIS